MKRKQKTPKPRNPAAVAMIGIRKSGASGVHGKSKKAERRADKIALRKQNIDP
jgi:hypothetical protein